MGPLLWHEKQIGAGPRSLHARQQEHPTHGAKERVCLERHSALVHQLKNGFTLLGEQVPGLESVAFGFALPAGSCHEAEGKNGLATLTCELLMRGAGARDNRAFHESLDGLGVERGESVNSSHIGLGAATLSEFLLPALDLYADALLRPHLAEQQLPAARLVVLQEIQATEDDPSGMVVQELGKQLYPGPWGRPSQGTLDEVAELTLQDVRQFHAQQFAPQSSLLAVAGKLDWPRLVEHVERLFADWVAPPVTMGIPVAAYGDRICKPCEGQQHHLAIAFPAVPFGDPQHLAASAGAAILGGGGNSRLFQELREKRGLCYSANASVHSFPGSGVVLSQVATSSERFAESLAVTMEVIQAWGAGIEEGEVRRLKARMKSALILQQESSSSRATAIARDWFYLHRVRPLEELSQAVDALNAEVINGYLAENPPRAFSTFALGPEELPAW